MDKSYIDKAIARSEAISLGIGAMMKTPAMEVQVGGDHYKRLAIQPMQIAHANDMKPWEYDALKYLLRWRYKGGREDLQKCIHCVNLGMELEFEKEPDQCLTPPKP